MVTLDTNIIIRYLTGDDQKKAKSFRSYLAKGGDLLLTDVTVAECFFVLTRLYKFSVVEIAPKLLSLTKHRQVICHKKLLNQTFQTCLKVNVGFVDAYTATTALESTGGRVLSFDEDFDRTAGIKRVEP